jgi:hypothetical protein
MHPPAACMHGALLHSHSTHLLPACMVHYCTRTPPTCCLQHCPHHPPAIQTMPTHAPTCCLHAWCTTALALHPPAACMHGALLHSHSTHLLPACMVHYCTRTPPTCCLQHCPHHPPAIQTMPTHAPTCHPSHAHTCTHLDHEVAVASGVVLWGVSAHAILHKLLDQPPQGEVGGVPADRQAPALEQISVAAHLHAKVRHSGDGAQICSTGQCCSQLLSSRHTQPWHSMA